MRIKEYLILAATVFLISLQGLYAQGKEGVTHSGQKTGQPPHPVKNYQELPNPSAGDDNLWQDNPNFQVSWGTIDKRYKKEEPIGIEKQKTRLVLSAWKGEQVSAQWVVSAYQNPIELFYEISDFVNTKKKSDKISKENLHTGFVRYVMTDELNKEGEGSCGHRKSSDFDSTLVADPIDHRATSLKVDKYNSQAGWISVRVPSDIKPGKYKAKVKIKNGDEVLEELDLVLNIEAKVLANPSDWAFHLDLWQNPYAVARYHDVEPWSDEHFDHLKMELLPYAEAGGKVITASITHKPWDGQTYDPFDSMVTWMKKADGSWYFDYTVFDKWVEFMMGLGIDKQINAYTMIPWRLSFQYYDQATNKLRYLEAKPGEKEYEAFWGTMLSSFAEHLKEKGWFEKTYIAMDERSMEAMQATLEVIHNADKDFKVSLAGDLHEEIENEIDDYCLTLGQEFLEETLTKRKKNKQISTYYTSCAHSYPNVYTFSPPAESEFLGWHAASENLDGFLRWAYNSWVKEPLLDSRFTTWAAGDTYLVYPGGRTSIRFERLKEGIQQYEKIQYLKTELTKKKDKDGLKKLDEILKTFKKLNPEKESAAEKILVAKEKLKSL